MEYKVGWINIVIIAVSMILFFSPLSDKPGAMHPILILPFFYCMFSFIPAGIVAISGLKKILKENKSKGYIAVVILNCIHLMVFLGFVCYHWEGWMGI